MTAHLTPANRQTHELLQKLWTKAVGTPGYDKEEWKSLERAIGFQPAPVQPREIPPVSSVLLPGWRCDLCEMQEKRCASCQADFRAGNRGPKKARPPSPKTHPNG